ncbi:MAG: hypothetical protein AAFS07_00605 [Pseudomonadota bacterium]
MLRSFSLFLAVALIVVSTPAAADVIRSTVLPAGTRVDLSSLATGVPLAEDEKVFAAAGIISITVTDDPSDNDEFYDGGVYGAGRALYNTEEGELIALDQGARVDFGSPTFTIRFFDLTDAFGLRIADTSQSFATPEIRFFRRDELIDTILIDEAYDATTQFGFRSSKGFDRVEIVSDTDGTGFGMDGVGITDLTVGNFVGKQ